MIARRRKPTWPTELTDREFFVNMPLSDTWDDADLYSVFDYLWKSKTTKIPESWVQTMTNFEQEFRSAVVADANLVKEYNHATRGHT